jgi:hypothetical protein
VITACILAITMHMGGSISDHAAAVRVMERAGCMAVIEGKCASACTMFLKVGCVTPGARLGFHAPTGTSNPARFARIMAEYLPPRLARWYLAGPWKSDIPVWITGTEAIRLGARRC